MQTCRSFSVSRIQCGPNAHVWTEILWMIYSHYFTIMSIILIAYNVYRDIYSWKMLQPLITHNRDHSFMAVVHSCADSHEACKWTKQIKTRYCGRSSCQYWVYYQVLYLSWKQHYLFVMNYLSILFLHFLCWHLGLLFSALIKVFPNDD